MDLLFHFLWGLAIYPIKRLYWLAYNILPGGRKDYITDEYGETVQRIEPLNVWLWGLISLVAAVIGWALIPLWIVSGYLFGEKIGIVVTLGEERWEVLLDFPELECIPDAYLSLGNLYHLIWVLGGHRFRRLCLGQVSP